MVFRRSEIYLCCMQHSGDLKPSGSQKRDLYFTNDYEWIDFQGSVAYIGVCLFKLTGIRKINKVVLPRVGEFFNADQIIASICNSEYKIDIHMPVTGRLLSCNEELTKGNFSVLLEEPETKSWIALIGPSLPYDRKGLLISPKYQMKRRTVL